MINVVLVSFGAPDSLDAVAPFMMNLTKGRGMSPEQIDRIKERYKLIGGKSPLIGITKKQAQALEKELNKKSTDYKVDIGMCYWKPYIKETINKIAQEGASRVVVVTLSPFNSRISTGAYFKQAKEVLDKFGEIKKTYIKDWFKNPLYLKSVVGKINERLSEYSDKQRKQVQLIFSIHSLPVKYIEEGDPYVEEVKYVISKVTQELEISNWHIAYQSKGRSGEWLKPEIEDLLERLLKEGKKEVLIVPLSFISDHVETLYDIDIVLKNLTEAKGMSLKRVAALNDSPMFISALADIITRHI